MIAICLGEIIHFTSWNTHLPHANVSGFWLVNPMRFRIYTKCWWLNIPSCIPEIIHLNFWWLPFDMISIPYIYIHIYLSIYPIYVYIYIHTYVSLLSYLFQWSSRPRRTSNSGLRWRSKAPRPMPGTAGGSTLCHCHRMAGKTSRPCWPLGEMAWRQWGEFFPWLWAFWDVFFWGG